MAYPLKIQRALEIVAAAGIPKWLAAPPPYRVLWLLGLEVRPPHFSNAVVNAVVTGLACGVLLGTIRLVRFIITGAPSPVPAALSFFTPIVITAFLIAALVNSQKRSAGLPKWDEVDVPSRFD